MDSGQISLSCWLLELFEHLKADSDETNLICLMNVDPRWWAEIQAV